MKQLKHKKRFFACFISFVMLLSVFCGSMTVFAAYDHPQGNAQIELQASRSGDILTVSLVAKDDLVFGGLEGNVDHEEDVEFVDYDASRFNSKDYYDTTTRFSMSAGGDLEMKAGDTIWSIRYRIKDGFEAGKEYKFDMNFTEVADPDETDYSWGTDSFTVIYKEAVTYQVVFQSQAGVLASEEVEKGNTVSKVPTATRAGYEFKGWSDGESEYTSEAVQDLAITGNTTFTAVWNKVTGDVTKIINLDGIKIKKSINTGITFPGGTFTFNLNPLEVEPLESQEYLQTNEQDMPAIGPLSVTVENGKVTGTIGLGQVEFPYGGIYTYEVTEVVPDQSMDGMTYDDETYTLKLMIEDVDGSLQLNTAGLRIIDSQGLKSDESMDFENTYVPARKLEVSKTVEGEPLDKNKAFEYEITLSLPNQNFETNGIVPTYVITRTGDAEPEKGTVAYGTPIIITLKHNEKISFSNVPEGVQFRVIETGTDYYTGTADVKGGENVQKKDGQYAKDVTVTGNMGSKDVTVAVTNEYSINPPDTGILHHSEMPLMLGLIVIAAAGSFVLNRKFQRKSR